MYAQFTYSAFFMLFGAMLLTLGFWRRAAFLRWQALVLLAVSIGKVFTVDVSELSQGYRILSFLGLGALLLGGELRVSAGLAESAQGGKQDDMNFRAMVVLLAVTAATPEMRYFRYERPVAGRDRARGKRAWRSMRGFLRMRRRG